MPKTKRVNQKNTKKKDETPEENIIRKTRGKSSNMQNNNENKSKNTKKEILVSKG